jgi:hypothetical protein
MAVLRWLALLAACALSVGCSKKPATADDAPRTVTLRKSDIHDIIERVIKVRQLKLGRPVSVERLSDEQMIARLRQGTKEPSSDGRGAVVLAFNLESDDAPGAAKELHEDLVLGLYDPKEHAILYRGAPRTNEDELRKQRMVIAHEVHHALQFSEFGAPKKRQGLDAELALDALYEGDAQVTMALFLGSESGVPLNRTLRTIFDIRDEIEAEELAHNVTMSHSLAVTKRLLLFPYDEGMRFVADIYRAGGLDLVNQLYEDPPTTTEHILHPNKFLAGELPTPVAEPSPPSGYRIIDHDTLGEFGISQVLTRCVGQKKARRAARGWAGDHYAVAIDDDDHVALLWSTVWDTKKRAKRFAKLLDKRPECWVGKKSSKWRIPEHSHVVREGKRVAIVNGIDEPAAAELAAALLALVGDTPPAKELTSARVPDEEPIPKASRGTLRRHRYKSKWLGIKAKVPDDVHATVSEDAELALREQGDAYAGLFVSDRAHTDAYNEATFRELHAAAVEGAGIQSLDLVALSDHTATTPLGQGVARLWGTRTTTVRMRVILVPVCYGTGSFVFVQAYDNDRSQRMLDKWLDSFRWLSMKPPPICKKLNPR